MSPEEKPLDFVFRWKEGDALRDTGHDSVSMEQDREEADSEGELEARGDDAPLEGEGLVGEGPTDDDLRDESFQWSAEREAALEEAFAQTPEGTAPAVQMQIQSIIGALQEGSLPRPRAEMLLGEVENYLAGKVKAEQRKVPVAHPSFVQSRADKLNALFSWQESVVALREYLENHDPVQLKVAIYASEQAVGLLDGALDMLLAAEPEPNDEELEGDDEDDPVENDRSSAD